MYVKPFLCREIGTAAERFVMSEVLHLGPAPSNLIYKQLNENDLSEKKWIIQEQKAFFKCVYLP